ncbi:serine O-acetyltransferase [Bacteroides ihuae]|uniref:serine O-acetyltransferase n=1 Tax=Bacteroides ihuae TaxID=1852362 RepID=UPI0008DA15FC|nr:serine acetyltransferase [Bacteroides ihuae]
MTNLDALKAIQENVDILSNQLVDDYKYIPQYEHLLPSSKKAEEIMSLIRSVIFPGYSGDRTIRKHSLPFHIGVYLERIYSLLKEQIHCGLSFDPEISANISNKDQEASNLAVTFINAIPNLKRLLSKDVKAIIDGNPATQSYGEVIFCYPAITALLHHRVAHELLKQGVPILPRIISELAHSATGIDIHPAAQIGEYFSIDHGTGVVIGKTTIIGNHVRLYQGVTLGSKSLILENLSYQADAPRHPILEDNVTIYSSSSILGRVTIGHDSVIGGNVWITQDVAPYSRIIQQKAIEGSFIDGLGI